MKKILIVVASAFVLAGCAEPLGQEANYDVCRQAFELANSNHEDMVSLVSDLEYAWVNEASLSDSEYTNTLSSAVTYAAEVSVGWGEYVQARDECLSILGSK